MLPNVFPSGTSGAHDSPYRDLGSRPVVKSAPARYPTSPSPEQSAKTGLEKVIDFSDPICHPVTDRISPSAASTVRTSVFRNSEIRGSARTASSSTRSQ